ncbi:DUF2158 domain-containing protein [Variovorax sp. YR566]|uniref:DUF2158 domain-containing protein n=1 Tax=Variovorax sp. YR566 TaxID=3450237 RepID=UPI003F820F69
MSDIKAGDTVKLKSGGVIMTVESVSDDEAYCVWQDGAKSVSHTYNLVVLQKYVPSSVTAVVASRGPRRL